jgi:hypothetical protein
LEKSIQQDFDFYHVNISFLKNSIFLEIIIIFRNYYYFQKLLLFSEIIIFKIIFLPTLLVDYDSHLAILNSLGRSDQRPSCTRVVRKDRPIYEQGCYFGCLLRKLCLKDIIRTRLDVRDGRPPADGYSTRWSAPVDGMADSHFDC